MTAALAKHGVLRADAQVPETSRSDRPWFVGVLLGTAGWMAGVFALVFVALLFKPSGTVELATAGVILLAAAFTLYASDRESAFFDQLALALSIASSCSERDLFKLGGRVGSTLYALSREPTARVAAVSSGNGRKPITLSTKPLSTLAPLEDDFDDDVTEAVTA